MRGHRVSSHGTWYCHPTNTSPPMFNLRDMSMGFSGLCSLRCAPYPLSPPLLPAKSNDTPSLEGGNKPRNPRNPRSATINHPLRKCHLLILLLILLMLL